MGNTIEDYTAINMWYKELDTRYNFSVGPTVVALSTTEQLKELAKLDSPYLGEHKEYVNCKGQREPSCKKLDLSGNFNLIHTGSNIEF